VPLAVTGRPVLTIRPIGTVPKAYDVFRAYEGMEERKIKIK
jgi:hypothetical protein